MTRAVDRSVTIPLTGAQHEITAGGYRAIATELGAGLRELSCGGLRVITGYRPDGLSLPATRWLPARSVDYASPRGSDRSQPGPARLVWLLTA